MKYILGNLLKGSYNSVRHPKTPLILKGNPSILLQSPIPWWGSIGMIIIGIGTWCISGIYMIGGLDEAARLMVYVPLGNLFGMSLPKKPV